MKDRRGNSYLPIWQRLPDGSAPTTVDKEIGRVTIIALMSPARQAEKALGLSGRQLRKYRKALRRNRESLPSSP